MTEKGVRLDETYSFNVKLLDREIELKNQSIN